MNNKKAIAIGTGAAVLAGVAFMANSASAIHSATRITVIAPDTHMKRVDLGKRGQSIGDRFVFSGPLHNRRGATVGRIDGSCDTTSAPGRANQVRQVCSITSTFNRPSGPGAEITVTGVGRVLAEDVDMAVVGGTAQYQNARGQATLDFRRKDQVTITYELIP